MNFSVIVPFLMIFSALSVENFAHKKRFDPRSFVASVANADPKVISQLSNYAQQLIDEGEVTRGAVIKARDDAEAVAAQAASDLADAIAHLEKSDKDQAEGEQILAVKITEEATARSIMDDAAAHQADSQSKFDDAQETMDTEVARIDQEDIDLKNVQSLLEELLPTLIQESLGRKLLSIEEVSVDPAALQSVIDLVVSLLEQGQVDKAAFIKARDDALVVLKAAIEDHNAKKTLHTHSVGGVAVATQCLKEKTDVAKKALDAKTIAVDEKTAKDSLAVDAEAHRDSEENRIDGERADFEKVIDLLKTL